MWDTDINSSVPEWLFWKFICFTVEERAFGAPHLPMLRHVAEPLDAGGLEADVGVEAAGDGLVDDGLLLLLQQVDEFLLGADVAADAPVHVVQVADDGALFGEGWEGSA